MPRLVKAFLVLPVLLITSCSEPAPPGTYNDNGCLSVEYQDTASGFDIVVEVSDMNPAPAKGTLRLKNCPTAMDGRIDAGVSPSGVTVHSFDYDIEDLGLDSAVVVLQNANGATLSHTYISADAACHPRGAESACSRRAAPVLGARLRNRSELRRGSPAIGVAGSPKLETRECPP